MKPSDIKENVEVLSITGTYGGCVLEDELNDLRIIPKFFANKAFQFLNDTMKGKYGRIELLELRRSLYTFPDGYSVLEERMKKFMRQPMGEFPLPIIMKHWILKNMVQM